MLSQLLFLSPSTKNIFIHFHTLLVSSFPHMFSIGLRSGLDSGQSMTLILVLEKCYFCRYMNQCSVLLNRIRSSQEIQYNGVKWCSNIGWYSLELIILLQKVKNIWPLNPKPPQIIILILHYVAYKKKILISFLNQTSKIYIHRVHAKSTFSHH